MRIKIIYYKAKYIFEPDEDNIISSLMKFCDLIKIDLKNLSFIHKGKELDTKKNLKEYKTKVLILYAYNLKRVIHDKNAKDILCPGCNNPAMLNIVNDEANIINCKRNHIHFGLPYKEFIKLNETKVIDAKCDVCGNDENLYGIALNMCSCGKNICSICLLYHDPRHKSINYYDRLCFCSQHNFPFLIYCHQCNINICEKCEPEHANHKTTNNKAIIPSDNELGRIEKNANEIIKLCKIVKDEINRTQMIFNKVVNYFQKNLEGYSLLNKNLLLWIKDIKNYETIKNIICLNENNKIYKKTLKDIMSYSFNNKINYLIKFYEDKKKELTIYYNNTKDNFIIFNETFVLKNKNNCSLIIRNEKKDLSEKYTIDEIYNESDLSTIKLKLIIEKKLNLYKMFFGCTNLISFDEDEFTNLDTDNITYLFSGCENVKTLPDLSINNVSNLYDFSNIFQKCCSLKSLPDISKWKTSKAIFLKCIFKDCTSLLYLPDISKWDTSSVQNMDELFSGCKSLTSLPNISVWDTSSLKSLNEMFRGCKSLTSFPEIRAWNISKVTDMIEVFKDCNINIAPDITISSKIKKSFLNTINYKQLQTKIYEKSLEKINYDKFCEAFLIISLNKKDGKNKERPEIIFKYPLDINNKFDLEDLSYSCFSTGIKAYIEEIPPIKKNFMFSFKNPHNQKYYLYNYYTYKKISLEKYYSEYKEKKENVKKEEIISETSSGNENHDANGFAFIPYCFCLISKYFYINQMAICLKSIYTLFKTINDENDYLVLRDLLLFIINSIPIPPINTQINFLIPCYYDYITIDCPIFKGYHLLNTYIDPALRNFISKDSENNKKIIWPLRILLNEKSLIILDKDENRLIKLCDAFLSLLYPFEWIHTYIPILNEKNVNHIDLSRPFFLGVNISMLDKVANFLKNEQIKEEVFLLYVYDGYMDFDLGSTLANRVNLNFESYFKKNIPDFPDNELYWKIMKIMKYNSKVGIKLYSNEAKILNREYQKNVMYYFSEYIHYIEKTKEKRRKPFYFHLGKTRLYDNYVKNKDSENLEYFKDMFFPDKKNKKKNNTIIDFESVKNKYHLNPYFSTMEEEVSNVQDFQKMIREKYKEDKINKNIFESDIELKESDFKINNDKILLIDEEENNK